MSSPLQVRKQKLIHDKIYNAAVDLFDEKGFEATTVDEIAASAGVSRRSFFRYFESKDDILSHTVIAFGKAQVASIENCPQELPVLQVLRGTVSEVLKLLEDLPSTRKVVSIAQRSQAAKHAHMSRIIEVEEMIAEAYARRIGGTTSKCFTPCLLAKMTTMIMGASVMAWYSNQYETMQAAADAVFHQMRCLFMEPDPR